MNHRLTAIAAIATFLASLSLSLDLKGGGWFTAALGAVIAVAIAGTLTRLAVVPAAIGATALVLMAVTPLWGLGLWAAVGAVGIVALVALSATGVRLLRVLAAACTYLAALLLFLNLGFAGAQSLARILPSMASMQHLSSLVNGGEYQFRYEPPLPLTPGLILLTAGGVGLVAIVVDVLAVRLRKPAIAGLPLLVLFCVPIASNIKHVGTEQVITFILGMTGFLSLLAADSRDRLRTWGKLITLWTHTTDEQEQGPNTKGMAASGRRIGLVALGVAIIVPLLLPGLTVHDLFARHHGVVPGDGHIGPAVLPDPVSQVQGDLTEPVSKVLSYTTTSPHTSYQYLQLYVLNYNAAKGTWMLVADKDTVPAGPNMHGVPGLTPQISRIRTATKVTMADVAAPVGQESFLALPYPPTSLSVSAGNWREGASTLMVSSTHSLAGLTYTVHSDFLDPTAAELATKVQPPVYIENNYAGYTGPHWHQLLRIAEQHTKGSTTELQKATALEDWFTSPGAFAYTVHSGQATTSPDWLIKFLTTHRRGFCVQFALAFATLARLLGIPARVAEGFTAGTPAGHGVWNVTTADAHMWPEVYFPGAGWLRFEPTPSGQGVGQGTATTPLYASGAPTSRGAHSQNFPQLGRRRGSHTTGPIDLHKNPLADQPPGTHPEGQAFAPSGPADLLPWLIAGLAIVAMLLLTPMTGRMLTRRRRWHRATDDAGLATAAWLELTDDLTDLGVAGPRSESARGLARRVTKKAALDQTARQAVSRIAAAQERAIYAPAPAPGSTLAADVRTVRRGVAASAPRAWRWRARLMPASTIDGIVEIGHNVANALTSVDRAVVWLGAKIGQVLRKPTTLKPLG